MAVDQEPDFKVTAETKIDEIDWEDTTCFMTAESENDVYPVDELPVETHVERWVASSGCSHLIAPSADYMVN